MVTSGEVLSLATPRCAIMWKCSPLLVSRLLESALSTIADLKMVSGIDAYTKSQPLGPYTFMEIRLRIILLTRNSILSKIAFPWSHLPLELSLMYEINVKFKSLV